MKKIIVSLVTGLLLTSVLCGCNVTVNMNAQDDIKATEEETVANDDVKTIYSFETFDREVVSIDASNIVLQVECDEPLESNLISAEAVQIAPGRDYILLEDESNYYVADLVENLVTISDKALIQPYLIVADHGVEPNGKVITPCEYEFDENTLEPGIYSVNIDAESGESVEVNDEGIFLTFTLYTMDIYDIVDINTLERGDTIIVDGREYIVDTVEDRDGFVYINDGIEAGGTELMAVDEDNCYVYISLGDQHSFTEHGVYTVKCADDVTLSDGIIDPEVVTTMSGDTISRYIGRYGDYSLWGPENTSVEIDDNGEIVSIVRTFVP